MRGLRTGGGRPMQAYSDPKRESDPARAAGCGSVPTDAEVQAELPCTRMNTGVAEAVPALGFNSRHRARAIDYMVKACGLTRDGSGGPASLAVCPTLTPSARLTRKRKPWQTRSKARRRSCESVNGSPRITTSQTYRACRVWRRLQRLTRTRLTTFPLMASHVTRAMTAHTRHTTWHGARESKSRGMRARPHRFAWTARRSHGRG